MRSTSDESSVPIKPSAIGCMRGALHSIDAKDLRRLRCPVEFTRRRLDDIIAVNDLERVDRGLTAHDTVEGTVAHEHVDSVVDGLGRNERTSAVVDGEISKPAGTACTPARVES